MLRLSDGPHSNSVHLHAWPPSSTPAAPPQLINKLPWWVETPCHQLLRQWKSIKNNTHLHPWAQTPFVFPVYRWRLLFYQNAFKQEKGWGWVGLGGAKTNMRERREQLSTQMGRALKSAGIKTPSLENIQLVKKLIHQKTVTVSACIWPFSQAWISASEWGGLSENSLICMSVTFILLYFSK